MLVGEHHYLPDCVASAQADPLGDRSVLPGLLCKLDLSSESFVGRPVIKKENHEWEYSIIEKRVGITKEHAHAADRKAWDSIMQKSLHGIVVHSQWENLKWWLQWWLCYWKYRSQLTNSEQDEDVNQSVCMLEIQVLSTHTQSCPLLVPCLLLFCKTIFNSICKKCIV